MQPASSNTILFDQVIFGPVRSRRLGVSLGINLLPNHSKLCNFNCIYCECGWTRLKQVPKGKFHSRSEVKNNLEEALIRLKAKNILLDTITFAGNGEPTMHPEFDRIMSDTIALKGIYFPDVKIAVLTNAAMLNNSKIVDALKRADLRILKLDAGTEELFQKINQPLARRSLRWIVDHLHYFKGNLMVQTLFLKGKYDNVYIDNTTQDEVSAWLKLIEEIHPETVMLYSLDRATPAIQLEKIPVEKLNEIAVKVNNLGINTMVS